MRLICGTTPLAWVLCQNRSPNPARLQTPSCMRAPTESSIAIIGRPAVAADSNRRPTFCACTSENDPPRTVKSCANTATRRPSIKPNPVTTPSPG